MENQKEKIKHIIWFVALTFILLICVWNKKGDVSKNADTQIAKETSTEDEKDSMAGFQKLVDEGYLTNANQITIHIDGLEESHTYCVINDMHIWASEEDGEIKEENLELVKSRIHQSFVNEKGIEAKDIFHGVLQNIKESEIDGLIMNSDIIDQRSYQNITYLKEELSALDCPYMYLRSDHDLASDWTSFDKKSMSKLEKDTGWNETLVLWEEEQYVILGINKSFRKMKKDTLSKIKEVFKKDKPVIIVTHVPYDSRIDREFRNQVEAKRGKRLIWGEDCIYQPDEIMKEYLGMVYDKESPVVAVVAAHLHDSYTVKLNDRITEYVLPPGYAGNITILTIE